MANCIYIPLARLPESLAHVREGISLALSEFGFQAPAVRFDESSSCDEFFLRGFLLVDAGDDSRRSWISFSECTKEVSEREGYNYIADVKTRGSWEFSGIIAYWLCLYSGYVVFNDAGELDGQESYSVESLRDTLIKRLATINPGARTS